MFLGSVLGRALIVSGIALAGLAALGWAGIALLVVITDPPSDTSGSNNGIGVDDYVGVALLFLSGLGLLFGAAIAATRTPWSVLAHRRPGGPTRPSRPSLL